MPRKGQPRDMSYIAERVEYDPFGGCWLWNRAPNSHGYGNARAEPSAKLTQIGAHVLSWIIHRGPLSDGEQVLHKCDIPLCVNPDHLFVGSQLDNMRDMHDKGRAVIAKGEDKANSKLTASQIPWIRQLYEDGYLQGEIAGIVGVEVKTISDIITGKTWKHV